MKAYRNVKKCDLNRAVIDGKHCKGIQIEMTLLLLFYLKRKIS